MAFEQTVLDQIENLFKVLEKEGNKVARDGALPPGKNADKGYDTASFNAGMRYGLMKIRTGLKQISDGRYTPVEFPRQGQHAVAKPAAKNGKATNGKVPAKKATVRKVTAKA